MEFISSNIFSLSLIVYIVSVNRLRSVPRQFCHLERVITFVYHF